VLLLTLLAVAPTDAVLFVVHCVCELLSDRVDAEGEWTEQSSHLGLFPVLIIWPRAHCGAAAPPASEQASVTRFSRKGRLAREIEVAYQAEVDRSEYLECLLQKVKKLAREPLPQAPESNKALDVSDRADSFKNLT